MRYRLNDGRIVPAAKDCDCCTHAGPHWIHMDDAWRARNRQLLQSGTSLGIMGHAQEEQARLRAKLYEMTSRGIAEIIRDEPRQERQVVGEEESDEGMKV